MFLLRLWKWWSTLDCDIPNSPYTFQVLLTGIASMALSAFRPTWPCLIVKVLAAWAKFLEQSGYCTVIFTFCTTNFFFTFCKTNFFFFGGGFNDIIVQFKLKVPKLDYMFICTAFKLQSKAMQKGVDTTNHSRYLPWAEPLQNSMYQNIARLLTHLNNHTHTPFKRIALQDMVLEVTKIYLIFSLFFPLI